MFNGILKASEKVNIVNKNFVCDTLQKLEI